MAGRKRRAEPAQDPVPSVYLEMLAEARASPTEGRSPPAKRKRPGQRDHTEPVVESLAQDAVDKAPPSGPSDADEDEAVEFEDVSIPAPTLQTITRDSDEADSDEEEEDGEGGGGADPDAGGLDRRAPGTDTASSSSPPRVLNLNLTAQRAAMARHRPADRRRAIGRMEKLRRVAVHKTHLLCLLSHVALRNEWCNDLRVQEALGSLLSEKVIRYLNPGSRLSQFGRTESLKNGLQQVGDMFRARYSTTERGIRRALWADNEQQLRDYQLPDDIESILSRDDFLDAARLLRGSRDVGAQLFCALLRRAGVQTRLVCSLQPLACVSGAPSMSKQKASMAVSRARSKMAEYGASMAIYEPERAEEPAPGITGTPSPRRRLGHPQAAAYKVPTLTTPPAAASRPRDDRTRRAIRGESPFPVYWVEVLDVAHQRWQPVDPLVTHTQWKPRALEPPASDRDNCMCYVVAFEADNSAKDVTRRYAKAYNAKTRKMRVDGISAAASPGAGVSPPGGQRWWRRAMRRYSKQSPSDVDQIEDNELTALEAKEPMPRNVADFKDHPVYALGRHLRKHEVLVPGAQPAGTVGAGSRGPLERIYRRQDVRIAWSRERWYRLGRVVSDGEEPVKILPKRVAKTSGFDDDDDDDDDDDKEQEDDDGCRPKTGIRHRRTSGGDRTGLSGGESAGTPVYMPEQTELYRPPPVLGGRVPKNKFGNLDVYVPSMVPEGGAHLMHERAGQAAFILGVDYAPALTGFRFKGRRGTAVLSGVVVPAECAEAVGAVIAGLEDLDAEMEQEKRTLQALRMWSRFLKGLRIRQRIWAGADSADEGEAEDGRSEESKSRTAVEEEAADDMPSHVMEDYAVGEDDEGGGGFMIE